jgi:competence protein ComEA
MPPKDWTTGPAKWAAVVVLGGASLAGLAWSMLTRPPARIEAERAPGVVEIPSSEMKARGTPDRDRRRPGAPGSAAKRININTASASELELLPGVGPALAGRIIEYRAANGAFQSVDDLENVKGVGPRTLEKLRPLVTVE